MNKTSLLFLQFVLLLVGILSLFILLRFPLLEGRAVNLSPVEIYSDPFILYAYFSSIFFFLGLYQGSKLLKQIGRNKLFTSEAIQTIQKIKYCSYCLAMLIVFGALYIRFFHHPDDDSAGFLALSMILILLFSAIGTAAFVFEKSIQKAVDLKNENDLTI
jgi:hypothetical protein